MPNSSERWRLRLMPLGLRKGTFPRTCVNFDLGQSSDCLIAAFAALSTPGISEEYERWAFIATL